MVWANQRVFMNKDLHKARLLRNTFLRKKLHLTENHIINKETTE